MIRKITGKIDIHQKGFGFVFSDEGVKHFIPKSMRNNSIQGDTVEIEIVNEPTDDKPNPLGRVIKVVERETTTLVAHVKKVGQDYIIVPDHHKINEIIICEQPYKLVTGTKVLLGVKKVIRNRIYTNFIHNIGTKGEKFVDLKSIYYNLGFEDKFSNEVNNEAAKVAKDVNGDDYPDRVDLRDKTIITIDGDDAKDLDDAIRVEKLENGNYYLGVYIADVAHYVKEGGHIDKRAYDQGTSVYLPGMVLPMLPKVLSNNICSLIPNVDRLVLGCEMEINNKGKVIKSQTIEAIIKTKFRTTYSEINDFYKTQKTVKYNEIKEFLNHALSLSKIIRESKKRKGMINFDMVESKIILDDKGKTKEIKPKKQGIAEALIEDFMVITNETVSQTISKLNLPSIYRVHLEPPVEELENFYQFARHFGKHFEAKKENIKPGDIQNILNLYKNEKYFESIVIKVLTSMEKAIYSSKNEGHFGLSSENYAHFTSPIRRYPDLILHRLVKNYLIHKNTDYRKKILPVIEKMCNHLSLRERKAIDCERKCNALKKTEWAFDQPQEKHTAKIITIIEYGMFVKLNNTIEGLVNIRDICDDVYKYNEATFTLVGEKNKRKFRPGDEIEVFIKHASLETNKIDFGLWEFKDKIMEEFNEFQKQKQANKDFLEFQQIQNKRKFKKHF